MIMSPYINYLSCGGCIEDRRSNLIQDFKISELYRFGRQRLILYSDFLRFRLQVLKLIIVLYSNKLEIF